MRRSARAAATGMRHASPLAAFHIVTNHSSIPPTQVSAAAPTKSVNALGSSDSDATANAANAAISVATRPNAATDCAAWKRTYGSRRSTSHRMTPVIHQPEYANGAAMRDERPVELRSSPEAIWFDECNEVATRLVLLPDANLNIAADGFRGGLAGAPFDVQHVEARLDIGQ